MQYQQLQKAHTLNKIVFVSKLLMYIYVLNGINVEDVACVYEVINGLAESVCDNFSSHQGCYTIEFC